jgi:hypothetical protein
VNSVIALTGDEPMTGNWFAATDFARAKMLEGRKRAPRPVDRADYVEEYTVVLAPLPVWKDLSVQERRASARAIVDEICQQTAERRKEEGAAVLGQATVMNTDRETRGTIPKLPWFEARQRMIVWAARHQAETRDYLRRYWAFQDAYRRASKSFLEGDMQAEFPPGAFRPVTWRQQSAATAA